MHPLLLGRARRDLHFGGRGDPLGPTLLRFPDEARSEIQRPSKSEVTAEQPLELNNKRDERRTQRGRSRSKTKPRVQTNRCPIWAASQPLRNKYSTVYLLRVVTRVSIVERIAGRRPQRPARSAEQCPFQACSDLSDRLNQNGRRTASSHRHASPRTRTNPRSRQGQLQASRNVGLVAGSPTGRRCSTRRAEARAKYPSTAQIEACRT